MHIYAWFITCKRSFTIGFMVSWMLECLFFLSVCIKWMTRKRNSFWNFCVMKGVRAYTQKKVNNDCDAINGFLWKFCKTSKRFAAVIKSHRCGTSLQMVSVDSHQSSVRFGFYCANWKCASVRTFITLPLFTLNFYDFTRRLVTRLYMFFFRCGWETALVIANGNWRNYTHSFFFCS